MPLPVDLTTFMPQEGEGGDAPQPDNQLLIDALKKRKRKDTRLHLSGQERKDLAVRITNDVSDAAGTNKEFRRKHVEFMNNWRGTPEPRTDGPLGEMSANVKVPLTQPFIEQWKSRLSKIILSEDRIVKIYSLVEVLDQGILDDASQWFDWELRNIVQFPEVLNTNLHYVLVDGLSVPIPVYEHLERRRTSCREFELDDSVPVGMQIEAGIRQCFASLGFYVNEIIATNSGGVFDIDVKDFEKMAKVSVLIEDELLVFELEYDDVVFDGVKVYTPNLEDVCIANTHEDTEKLPHFTTRSWISVAEFWERFDAGEYFDITEMEADAIASTGGAMEEEIIPQMTTKEQDIIEGSRSRGEPYVRSNDDERQWIEIYRWESFVNQNHKRIGIVAWVAARSQVVLKHHRLEELNKDGLRSPVKQSFIPVPGRYYPMGMAELLYHSQVEIDGVHNFRLDSALVATIPFGFYTPMAGQVQSILKLRPGEMYPIKNPDAVVFPKLNWNPIWGFQEEGLIRKYASETAGLGDPGLGTYASKRTSATEFAGTAQALDVRTEHVAKIILRGVEQLLERIFGLYQQHSTGERIFQIAGADGLDLVRSMSMDKLHGKLKLQLMGSVRHLSREMEREIDMSMLQVLANQFAIQLGIVRPETLYAAIKKVMDSSDYRGVPIFKPQSMPDSPPPDEEAKAFMAGVYLPPHLGEDFGGHLQAHMMLAQRPDLQQIMPPEALPILERHINETMMMKQQVDAMRAMQAVDAQQMTNATRAMGIRPGEAGDNSAGGGEAQPASAAEKSGGIEGAEVQGNA